MRSSRSSGSNRSNRFRTDDLNGLNLGGKMVLREENKLRVAVDIGGTFTDVVVFDEAKRFVDFGERRCRRRRSWRAVCSKA